MSISRWINKGVLVHIHNGILLSYKKEHIWVSSHEMDEPGSYYTEWRKSERHTLCIKAYTYGIKKDSTSDPTSTAAKETQMWRTDFGLSGESWWWDNLREQHWNIYITICEIDLRSRFDAWDRVLGAGALGWLWKMRWGRGFWMGNICTPMADSCQCMAKPTTVL